MKPIRFPKYEFLRAVLLIILSACSPFAAPTPTDSGIEGQVLIGPMCPVVQIGVEYPDQPYLAELSVLRSNGSQVLRFRTDEKGSFRVPLAPGEYVLRPESSNMIPFAAEQTFTVLPGQFTRIIVNYDSGIR
jgi:hypothetical protein